MGKLGADLGGKLISSLVDALKGLGSFGLDVGKSFANAIIGFINRNVINKINDLLTLQSRCRLAPRLESTRQTFRTYLNWLKAAL
jgi:hypothetical protein